MGRTMSVFADTLRSRIAEEQAAIADARDAGHDNSADLHTAVLADLLDLAARHDVDTTGWVQP